MNGFERRKLKKMQQIEQTVLTLLNSKPFSDISMQEIANLANVSKVTLFNYYENKEKLLNTTILNVFTSLYEKYEELLDSNKSFEETYKGILKIKLGMIQTFTSTFLENSMRLYANEPSFFDNDAQKRLDELTLRLFEKGRKEGKINADYDDTLLLMLLHIFSEGMKSPQLQEKELMQYSEQLLQILMNGLR
ncbi:transcriptional regulator, TetR family [Pilibacter termitis]|uniref:Transcriptional regulator, TetR family n=1 Tax=Pilibacter termitis TaxID=263852 RepID=A0A1T4NPB7_9ENTE|nr:TetR/AcrR family transcriptional regulator [Pilibacter termitis]SJZ81160.1 transcriptional regulator, TetR family [Pilibacter termitis]